MKNISFSMTTEAIRNQTKTVTRRLAWWDLRPGTLLMAVEKGMGLKKGEKVVRLGVIRVVSVRREALSELERLTLAEQALEMQREGFPRMTVPEFISMFTEHNHITAQTEVNRIRFEYVETP